MIKKLSFVLFMTLMICAVSNDFAMEQQKKAADFIETAKQQHGMNKKAVVIKTGMILTGCAAALYLAKKCEEDPEVWAPVLVLAGIGSGIGLTCYGAWRLVKAVYNIAKNDSSHDYLDDDYYDQDYSDDNYSD